MTNTNYTPEVISSMHAAADRETLAIYNELKQIRDCAAAAIEALYAANGGKAAPPADAMDAADARIFIIGRHWREAERHLANYREYVANIGPETVND